MANNISQKEYLKRYLNKTGKSKKKSKTSKKSKNIKIIDDDNDIKNINEVQGFDLYNLDEDAPQIVGIIDERSSEIQALDKYKDNYRWKVIDKCDEGDADLSVSQKTREGEREAARKENVNIANISDDLSPPRKRRADDSSIIQKKGEYDDLQNKDLSPPRRDKSKPVRAKKTDFNENRGHSPPARRSTSGNRRHIRTDDKRELRIKNEFGKDDANTADFSPPRRPRETSRRDLYENGKAGPKRYEMDSGNRSADISPPRRWHDSVNRVRSKNEAPRNERNRSDHSPRREETRSYERYGRKRRLSDRELPLPRRPWKDDRYRDETYRHGKRERNNPRHRDDDFGEITLPSRKRKLNRRKYDDYDDYHEAYPTHHDDERYHSDKVNDDDLPLLFELVNERRLTDTVPLPVIKDRGISKATVTNPIFEDGAIRKHVPEGRDSVDRIGRKIDKLLHVKQAGLQDARHLRIEAEQLLQRETKFLEQLNEEISGKSAAPIIRDRKTGRHRDIEQEVKLDSEKRKLEEEREKKYYKWGRGLKQIEDAREKYTSDLHEMSKPFARYADDVDLERHLKNQERDGDPMLSYLKNKQSTAHDTDADKTAKGKKRQYRGSYLPNRFNIPPGYKWDGVDRSNGYEKKWFNKQNQRRALEEEAYKWSTSDM